ncbi:MAG: helix-turn-helix domain protein [Acidimicrobiales bacterium]|nr:helix-turn-helix domain protein [Acidimicrobiales bacterium]
MAETSEAGAPLGTAARLAERIGERLVRGPEPITFTFREVIQFVDDVRDSPVDEVRSLLAVAPGLTGDRRWDAVVAAVVDWLAADKGLVPPPWTQSADRALPPPGWVVTRHVRLHEYVRANTPPEFASHGVYVDAASLVSV